MTLTIANGTLVTVDPLNTVIKNGFVTVDGDRITAMGHTHDAASAAQGGQIIDATGMLVLPGLVNAHAHLSNTLVRSLAADTPLLPWLEMMMLPFYANAGPDEAYAGTLMGCVEAICSGTTTVVENYYPRADSKPTVDSVAMALADSGLRAVLVRHYHDRTGMVPDEFLETTGEVLAEYARIVDKWHNTRSGRLTIGVGPVDPLFTLPKSIRQVHQFAVERDVAIHIHAAECRPQHDLMVEEYGQGYVRFLDSLGVLDSRLTCAHAVCVDEDDIEILATRQVKVAHNPVSNMYLGSGISPVARMRAAGVVVGLGTDGPGSNNTVDMIETMKIAALLQKVDRCDPSVISANDVLRMATIDGARLLGLEAEIGSIEVGKKADLILVDMRDSVHAIPAFDPVAALVYSGRSADVDTVIIDGNVIMKGRVLRSVDRHEVMRQAVEAAAGLAGRVRSLGRLVGAHGQRVTA